MLRALDRLAQSRPLLLSAAAVLLAAVSVFHWLSHREYEVAIFAILPIALVSWYLGFAWGFGLSVAALLPLSVIDISAGLETYSHPSVPMWNNWMRFGIFTLVANLVARLASHTAFKTKMLSLVTHEFNHSLTVVGVAVSLLRKGDPQAEQDARRPIYSTIERQHAALRQLVANFLNFNRIEQGKFTPNLRGTDAKELVEECVKGLEPLTSQKGIDVQMDFGGGERRVKADPDALSLVVSNLIGNAVKFTERGGRITVRVSSPKDSDGRLRFAVEDTGVGIGEDEQRRIRSGVYEPKPMSLTDPQGFGLGLKLVEDILRTHEAELTIRSWPGQGSVFSFELPAEKR